VAADSVDPLDAKTSRHAGECEFASATDPAVLKVLSSRTARVGATGGWSAARATPPGQVPYYAESIA
jgi:hypothetical protein